MNATTVHGLADQIAQDGTDPVYIWYQHISFIIQMYSDLSLSHKTTHLHVGLLFTDYDVICITMVRIQVGRRADKKPCFYPSRAANYYTSEVSPVLIKS